MAEGNQPQKSNLAAEAFMRHYAALHDALALPDVASMLAIKLYGGAIITPETRDAIQTTGITSAQQASWLLQAVESSIKIDHRRLRKFTRLMRKQSVLSPIATKLRQCYSDLVSEARLTESSSSGSDTDSTEQHQPQGNPKSSMLGQCEQDSGEACTKTKKRIEDLEEKYLALVEKTQTEVMEQNPDLATFRTKITLLPTSLKDEHQQYIKDNLPQLYRADSIPEIFGLLNLYWNYLHYGLLQRIIEVYGSKDTKKLMKSYIRDVESFQQETTLAMFWEANPKQKSPKQVEGKIVEALTSHVKLTSSSLLTSVEELRQEFAREFLLLDVAIVIKKILPGSVIIVWLMPAKGAITLRNLVKEGKVEFFKQHHIFKLQVDDDIIYSSEWHLPSPKNRLSPIAVQAELQALLFSNSSKKIVPHSTSKPIPIQHRDNRIRHHDASTSEFRPFSDPGEDPQLLFGDFALQEETTAGQKRSSLPTDAGYFSKSGIKPIGTSPYKEWCCHLECDGGSQGVSRTASGVIVKLNYTPDKLHTYLPGLRPMKTYPEMYGSVQTSYILITCHHVIPGMSKLKGWNLDVGLGKSKLLELLVCGAVSCCGENGFISSGPNKPIKETPVFSPHLNGCCLLDLDFTLLFLNSTFEKLVVLNKEGVQTRIPEINLDLKAENCQQLQLYQLEHRKVVPISLSVTVQPQDSSPSTLKDEICVHKTLQVIHYTQSDSQLPQCPSGSPLVSCNADGVETLVGIHVIADSDFSGSGITMNGIFSCSRGSLRLSLLSWNDHLLGQNSLLDGTIFSYTHWNLMQLD